MNIEEIINDLNAKIEMQYGIKRAIHTVVFDHESFDKIIIELYRSHNFKYKYRPSDINDLRLCGIRVLARNPPEDKL